MKFAYYPGCAIHSSAPEYGLSCKAISEVLGIELVEIPKWNCCSSIDAVYAKDPLSSMGLAARNLSLAENMKMDIVVLCSACLFTLSRANKMLHEDSELKGKVDALLTNAGLNYHDSIKVRHYLDVLANNVGFNKVSEHVKIPLKGLKVAPYYGCLLTRPPSVTNFDDPEHPKSMDKLIEALGAQTVKYEEKCCGASLGITDELVMMEMAKRSLLSAKNAGADCIIAACPLCQFNLDARQPDIQSQYNVKIDLPVLYFTQLIGIAFGLSPKELGLDKNCVSPKPLLKQFQMLRA